MKRLSFALMAVLMCLTVVSCSTVKEEAVDAIASVSSPLVAKYGDCANQEAISADIKTEVSKWFKLEQKEGNGKSGAIAETVCQVAVQAVLPPLVSLGGKQLPEKWECKLTKLETSVVELSKEACSKLSKD